MLSSSGPSGPLTLWMALAPVLPGSLSHVLSLQRALVLLPRLPSLPLVHCRCAAPSPSFSHIVCTLLVGRSSHLRGSLVLWCHHPPLLRILPAHPPSCTAHSRVPSLSCPASRPRPATCPRPVHPHPAAHPRPASLPLVLPPSLPPLALSLTLTVPPVVFPHSPLAHLPFRAHSLSRAPLACSLASPPSSLGGEEQGWGVRGGGGGGGGKTWT